MGQYGYNVGGSHSCHSTCSSDARPPVTIINTCYRGNDVEAQQLIMEGADVNWKNEYGDTPLIWAPDNGPVSVVPLLLNKGANIHHKTNSGGTVLNYVAIDGQDEVVWLLIERGANLHVKDNNGQTPVDIA